MYLFSSWLLVAPLLQFFLDRIWLKTGTQKGETEFAAACPLFERQKATGRTFDPK
jgi:hypothetical protein